MLKNKEKVSVLFVCLGNICRSPSAEGVFRALVEKQGLADMISVDSAGTAAYHVGNPPDERAISHGRKRGYDISGLRARQAISEDFHTFDYILAMDHSNFSNLQAIAPADGKAKLALMLDYTQDSRDEVPDPYYGGAKGFELVLDLLEQSAQGLLADIRRTKSLL